MKQTPALRGGAWNLTGQLLDSHRFNTSALSVLPPLSVPADPAQPGPAPQCSASDGGPGVGDGDRVMWRDRGSGGAMPGWTKWDPGGANRRQSVVLKFGFEDLFKTYCCVSDTHTHTHTPPALHDCLRAQVSSGRCGCAGWSSTGAVLSGRLVGGGLGRVLRCL